MFPTLFTIPFLPACIGQLKAYSLFMMIAFLTGIWWSARRAERVQANPDVILNMGFIALVFGVLGARAMFVIHYWDTRFGNQPNPWLAAMDITAGGLEFLGGPIAVIPALYIYMKYIAKVSARWYYDISAPALASGLAFARIGCFLNGCCWGSVCTDPADPSHRAAALPWAVRFPYASPAMQQQSNGAFGQLTLPKELIWVRRSGEFMILPPDSIARAVADDRDLAPRERAAFEEAFRKLIERRDAGADAAELAGLRSAAKSRLAAYVQTHPDSPAVPAFEQCLRYDVTPRQLAALADLYRSVPVHPVQLYAVVNAALLSWLLSRVFYYRRRHGIVLPLFLMLYAIARFVEELIRQDNPLDVGGLTISQGLSLALFVIGALAFAWMYRLPMTSPLAVRFVPPPEEPAPRR